MLPVLLRRENVAQFHDLAVDAAADKAFAADAREDVLVLALFAPDHRRQDHQLLAVAAVHDVIHDLVGGLLRDGPVALEAVGVAHPGIEQPKVVVNLRAGGHGGARGRPPGSLLDRDGGGQSLDRLHVRLLHLLQELPGVGGKRLDVAPLALGVEGVKGQRGLAGAGEAGDDDEPVSGEVDIDPLEVVFPRAADAYKVFSSHE